MKRQEEKTANIAEKVKKIIVEQLMVDPEEVKEGSSFTEDLGADSLNLVELIMALEDEFRTKISEEEAEKITTVGEAIQFISDLVEEK